MSTNNFPAFAKAVNKQLGSMTGELFKVAELEALDG